MRRKYHQSEIQTYLKCGKAWDFRYIQKIVIPPRAALTVGKTVDKTVNVNLTQKVKSGIDLPKLDLLDIAATEFEKESKNTDWGEDDPGQQKDATIEIVTLHSDKVSPIIQPATVQEEFFIETDAGYDIGGTLDYTDKSGLIGDTKTSSRQRASSYTTFRSFQPAIYDFAYGALRGEKSKGFRFDVITKPSKTKSSEYLPISGTVTEDDHSWLFSAINNVDKAIRAGVALPAPEGAWWCSKDWCGYWHMCKGKGK